MEENKKFGHVMVDIETMGNESRSAIISIGAVEFNMVTGDTGKEFYKVVTLQSCMDLGLELNASTVMWWLQQSDEARKAFNVKDAISIQEALMEFTTFVNECGGKEVEIWGNSARFDLGIMSDAYNKAKEKMPWDFRKERCVRTLVSFLPEIKNLTKNYGIAHNALADCHFQIRYCSEIWNTLKSNR